MAKPQVDLGAILVGTEDVYYIFAFNCDPVLIRGIIKNGSITAFFG